MIPFKPLVSDSEMSEFRQEALARMKSRVTIWREGGRVPQNEDTGLESTGWNPVYTNYPFRLRRSSLAGSANGTRRVVIADIEYQMSIADGHFPIGTQLEDNDLIDITYGENEGTIWKVVEAEQQDQQTSVRVPIIQVKRPPELV